MKIEHLTPVTLVGQVIRLEPLSEAHIQSLTIAGQDESIWQFMIYGDRRGAERMRDWVEDILSRQARGTDLAFTIILLTTNRPIGSTRFINIDLPNRAIEIGGTWFAPEYRGTAVNSESKLLLLTYAFEDLHCLRVTLKTDTRNIPSQRAIERLGAKKEGVLRKHMINPDGFVRDSVVYSIIDSEWPAVKRSLIERLKNKLGNMTEEE